MDAERIAIRLRLARERLEADVRALRWAADNIERGLAGKDSINELGALQGLGPQVDVDCAAYRFWLDLQREDI